MPFFSLLIVCAKPAAKRSCPADAQRKSCTFQAGAKVSDTLCVSDEQRAAIPITHVVVVMQENRSFDHYYGQLSKQGQPDAEGPPSAFTNPDTSGDPVSPYHLTDSCLPEDPPHQWTDMHAGWDMGRMDGFVKSAASIVTDGHFVMGYYDQSDMPFYYWLVNTFAISDRYFSSALGGTWANRDYLYAGTSGGVMSTGQATFTGRTVFDALDAAGVGWGSYSDGNPRQDCLGWTPSHVGVYTFGDFISQLGDGSLPPVAFVDPGPLQDEHPTGNIHLGEAWAQQIFRAAVASPLWPKLAIVYTYDESGGLADHVVPPPACIPSPDQADFYNLGMRVPMILISPWAKPHYVSHVVHDHTSALRLIELVNNLGALTARDANADALLDLFDFSQQSLPNPTGAPEPAAGICP